MESVLVKVAEQTSPAAMAAGFKPLSNGVISYASDLFKAFTDDDLESSKLNVIKTMALSQGLSVAEFKEECAKAQKLADETDALNGFVAVDKPKTMEERYGLKRRVFNQRLSEAKRLFGVFKQAPDVLKEKGYAAALLAARQWLTSHARTWEGDAALSSTEKQAKAERKALAREVGEQVAAGLSIESAVATAKQVVQEKAIQELADSLAKKYDADMLITACLRILEAQSIEGIDDAIAYLSEAKMLAQTDNIPE